MTTLRVLIDRASLHRGLESRWALREGDRVLSTGTGAPPSWPPARRTEGLIAPDLVRTCSLRLPPLPPARRADAVRFALEDQAIGGAGNTELAVSAQQPDGTLRAALIDAAAIARVRAAPAALGRRWNALVPLSECIAAMSGHWTWLVRDARGSGWVVKDDGEAFDADPAEVADEPPAALAMAVAEAAAEQRSPRAIEVFGADETLPLEQWSAALGVPMARNSAWPWPTAVPRPGAIELSTPPAAPRRPVAWPLFRRAAWLAAAAAAIHGAAVAADWALVQWRLQRVAELQRSIAQTVAADLLASQTPAAAVARRLREARHRIGAAADDDFAPLLSAAARPLARLPAGALRAISYSGGQITLELGSVPAGVMAAMQNELAGNGLAAVAADTPGGARVRVGIE